MHAFCYSAYKVKEREVGGTYSTRGIGGNLYSVFVGDTEGKRQLGCEIVNLVVWNSTETSGEVMR
jgi:hypothetical protein